MTETHLKQLRLFVRAGTAASDVDGPLFRLISHLHRRFRIFLLPVWTRTQELIAYGPEPDQQLAIIHPRWPTRHSWPVVAVFHGGGWRQGSPAEMLDRVCRRYLEKGFMVANIGYRCAGFVPSSEDAVRAIEWVASNISNYGGDPGRLLITGESAGAHLALLAGFTSRARVRALINFYAVTDLNSFPGSAKDDSLPANNIEDTLRRLSPIRFVRPGLCPVISIHGTADSLVPADHTFRLTRQLRQVGVDAAEIIVAGGKHGFPEHDLDTIYQRVFEFLESHANL